MNCMSSQISVSPKKSKIEDKDVCNCEDEEEMKFDEEVAEDQEKET